LKQTFVALGVLGLVAAVSCGGTPAQPTANTIVLHEADAGKTFNVHGGDTIRVILVDKYPVPGSSLVWTVRASPDSVLKAGGWSRSSQVRDSGPGRTDTYTADFTAVAAGRAKVDAKGATSCEAMAKTGCPDQALGFTVVVGR